MLDKIDTYEDWVEKTFPHPWYGENDFHAVSTIQLGELIDCGWFNWSEEDGWIWDYYSEEQKIRLQRKIDNHYFWREIGILPPKQWKMEFLRTLNEIMPKYKWLYAKIEDGFDPFLEYDKWGKSRRIGSEFPQTMLSGNSDYASDGDDREYEELKTGDVLEKWLKFQDQFRDVDVMIIEDLDCLFSHLSSVSFNGW